MRDIIRATDLASGTFYNYFKSKEEVFQAIQDESALRIRPRLRAERIRAKSVEEFIAGTFRTFFEYVASDRATFAVARKNSDILRVRMDTPRPSPASGCASTFSSRSIRACCPGSTPTT